MGQSLLQSKISSTYKTYELTPFDLEVYTLIDNISTKLRNGYNIIKVKDH